ncbi:MAG TPA: PP0621 family protein [Methylotenera sp.]|nr:PP0621 family protein [Methylotenera sp.]
MMWRLIFLGLVIWLVIYFFKRNFGKSNLPKNSSDQPLTNESENNIENENIENMVQCSKCAVHLPRSEAFLVDGNFYCSKAHIEKK